MEIIFRIQDKDGRGPWKPGFSHKWVRDRPDHDNLKSWLQEFPFPNLDPTAFHGTGCRTVKQLRRWFTKKEYKTLKKYGYSAVKMVVDGIVAESDIQVLFYRFVPLRANVIKFKLY